MDFIYIYYLPTKVKGTPANNNHSFLESMKYAHSTSMAACKIYAAKNNFNKSFLPNKSAHAPR